MLDIISAIFAHCVASTLASCATVCRLWEVPSLRELWREVDDYQVEYLFRHLWPNFATPDLFVVRISNRKAPSWPSDVAN